MCCISSERSLLLLISSQYFLLSLLRFGRRFELPLLAQSFIMIFAMLMLLQLCTQVLRESNLSGKRRRFAGVYQIKIFSIQIQDNILNPSIYNQGLRKIYKLEGKSKYSYIYVHRAYKLLISKEINDMWNLFAPLPPLIKSSLASVIM